jgi:hypothetical protein
MKIDRNESCPCGSGCRRNALANCQTGSRIGLTSLSILFANVSYDLSHTSDDRWKQDRDNNRRTSSRRRNSQGDNDKEQRRGTSNHSPLSQQSPERVAVLLLRERPDFWPPPHRRTRQPVGDVRRNGQGSDAWTTKLLRSDGGQCAPHTPSGYAMVLPRIAEKAQYFMTRLGHGNSECRSLSVPQPFGRRH